MSRLSVALAAATAAMTLAPSAMAATLESYGRLPSIEIAALSADGSTIALVGTEGAKRVLAVRKAGDSKDSLAILLGAAKVRQLQWVGVDHLLLTVSLTATLFDVIAPRDEWFEVIDINLKTRTQMNILGAAQEQIRAAISTPAVRVLGGQPYVFIESYHFADGLGRDSLFRINLTTGELRLVAVGKPETSGWLVDRSGAPVAESRYSPTAQAWSLLVRGGADWRVVDQGSSAFGGARILGLGRDGRSVLSIDEQGGRGALRELTPGAKDWGEPFAADDDQDQIFDPVDERLIGTHALVGDSDHYVFFAASDQAAWDAATKAFGGARITLDGLSADHTKLLVKVDSPTDGEGYALFDAARQTTTAIGPAFASLTPGDIGKVEPITFKAGDGLALSGYLTLPSGRDAKALPLVVFPHGGPAVRDEPGFDWWAQAMASKGYAVLQVNYRGSDGFGEDFLQAGYGQYGRKMQTDLSDGVRYLAARGTIDPKRVCIVGASYGGYAALAGPTLDPGVYRCAVAVAGISDLTRFVDWSANQHSVATQRYWTRYLGAAGPKDPVLDQLSPAAHVNAVTAPILLIHGKDDTVVPFEQSQIMADALKRAGKPVDFVVLDQEDHWLSRSDTRLQMLQATMDFLAKNNPAQ